MDLILWRHADAEPTGNDMKRELTDKGRKQAARVAKWLREHTDGDWRVVSSPAARARQTAEALDRDFEKCATLGPLETENALLREVGWPHADKPVIVVGHQPTLGRVAARLLTGRLGDLPVKKGSLWWFTTKVDEENGTGETILKAVITPDLAA